MHPSVSQLNQSLKPCNCSRVARGKPLAQRRGGNAGRRPTCGLLEAACRVLRLYCRHPLFEELPLVLPPPDVLLCGWVGACAVQPLVPASGECHGWKADEKVRCPCLMPSPVRGSAAHATACRGSSWAWVRSRPPPQLAPHHRVHHCTCPALLQRVTNARLARSPLRGEAHRLWVALVLDKPLLNLLPLWIALQLAAIDATGGGWWGGGGGDGWGGGQSGDCQHAQSRTRFEKCVADRQRLGCSLPRLLHERVREW